jgi:hypothetical protein
MNLNWFFYYFIFDRLTSQEQDRIHLWQRLEQMSLEKQNK